MDFLLLALVFVAAFFAAALVDVGLDVYIAGDIMSRFNFVEELNLSAKERFEAFGIEGLDMDNLEDRRFYQRWVLSTPVRWWQRLRGDPDE